MKVFFASWFANAIALYILARFLPGINIDNLVPPGGGIITWAGFIHVMVGALILGFFNSVVKPILNIFALPLTCLTLGLFVFVVTGVVFYLGALLTPGLHVASFWWAIIGGVLFGILNSIIGGMLGAEEEE